MNRTIPPKVPDTKEKSRAFKKEVKEPSAKEREVPKIPGEKPEALPLPSLEKEPVKKEEVLPPKFPPPPLPPPKSPSLLKIENILEEDLESTYQGLAPQVQKEFKEKGEETASEIEKLITKAKVKVQQILELIKKWLRIIPGINKFFLEQEAKIKTDKIIRLRKNIK